MRTISIRGKASNFESSSKAIKSAEGNADYIASQELKENEVIINKTYHRSFSNGRDGTSETSYIIGTLEEKIQYNKAEKEMAEFTLTEENKNLLLELTKRDGVDKILTLLNTFLKIDLSKPRREIV